MIDTARKDCQDAVSTYPGDRKVYRCTRSGLSGNSIYTDQNSFSPSALVPFTTLQLVYGKGDSIDNLTFTTQGLTDEVTNEKFEQSYRRAMGLHKNFDPTDQSAIWMWNRFTQYLQQESAARMLHIAIWVIGIFHPAERQS